MILPCIYLGHLVNGTGVKPDPKKVATLDSWQPPLAEVAKLSQPTTSAAEVSVASSHCKVYAELFGLHAVLQSLHSAFQRDGGGTVRCHTRRMTGLRVALLRGIR